MKMMNYRPCVKIEQEIEELPKPKRKYTKRQRVASVHSEVDQDEESKSDAEDESEPMSRIIRKHMQRMQQESSNMPKKRGRRPKKQELKLSTMIKKDKLFGGSASSKKEQKILTRNERIKLIEEYKNSKKGRRPTFYHDWLYKELENELRLQKRRDNRNKLKIEKKIFDKVVNEGKLELSDS